MKRLIALLVIAAFVALMVVPAGAQTTLDYKSYTNSHQLVHAITPAGNPDSVVFVTDSLTGGTSGSPLFYAAYLERFTTFSGIWQAYISANDSDNAANDTADLANDTLILTIYTAYDDILGSNSSGYKRAGETAIFVDTLTCGSAGAVANRETGAISCPSTAVLGDVVYGRLVAKYQTEAVGDSGGVDTLEITYETALKLNFK